MYTKSLKTEVPDQTMFAVVYIRVSTSLQTSDTDRHLKNHVSIDQQKNACLSYCDMNDIPVKEIYSEIGSASNMIKRKELLKALDAVDQGCYLVFYNLSRLSRSLQDFLTLREKFEKEGKFLVSVKEHIDNSSPQGKLMSTLTASFGEYEREMTCVRVKDSMDYARKMQHNYCNKPPFGYIKVDKLGFLLRNEEELDIIREMFKLYDNGVKYTGIALLLNEKKKFNSNSRPWNYHSIMNRIKARDCYMKKDGGFELSNVYEIEYSPLSST